MKKINRYRYVGKNGFITSSVLLENINHIKMYTLIADVGKVLTDGYQYLNQVQIFAEDLDNWTEVELEGKND